MLRRPCLYIVTMLPAILCTAAHAQTASADHTPPSAQINKQTLAGIDKLQTWYTQSTGLYQTTGWWNSANVLTMLADYSLAAKSSSYNAVFSNSFQATSDSRSVSQ